MVFSAAMVSEDCQELGQVRAEGREQVFSDKWRQRLRKGGRILLYGLIVIHLLAVLGDLNSIQSDISSVESDLDSIQSDVDSIQSDVSSIEGNMPTAAHTGQHKRPQATVRGRPETISFRGLPYPHRGLRSLNSVRAPEVNSTRNP